VDALFEFYFYLYLNADALFEFIAAHQGIFLYIIGLFVIFLRTIAKGVL